MFFPFLLLTIFLFSPAIAYDPGLTNYKCPQKQEAESRLSVLPGGKFMCTYTFEDGTSRSFVYASPQHNSSFARDVANTMAMDPEIKKKPIEERRLAAAQKVLKERGADAAQAAELLEYVDAENDREIEESTNNIFGSGADAALDSVGADKIAAVKESLQKATDMSRLPSKDIVINEEDMDSHSEYRQTIPAILTGLLTFDPQYFGKNASGQSTIVNSVGELDLNPEMVKVYYPDHTKDNFLAKTMDKMVRFLIQKDPAEQIKQFKPVEFMDQQVLGFLVYLMAALQTGYMRVLNYVFMIGAIGMITAMYYRVAIHNLINTVKNKIIGGADPQLNTGKGAIAPKHGVTITMIFSLVFFLSPSIKVDFESPIKDKEWQMQSYATPAQELVRYCAQSGTMFANRANDYAMKAYIALLNFKMGFVKDGLPKYIGEVSDEMAQIEADKAKLAASAALYNNYCKPYKDGEKFNIPSAAQNRLSSSMESTAPKKIAFIGDQSAAGLYGAIDLPGADKINLSSKSMKIEGAIGKVDAATAADLAIISIGIDDILSSKSDITETRKSFEYQLGEVVLPLKASGTKVVCVSPAKTNDSALNVKIEAIKGSFRSVCGTTLEAPQLSKQQMQGDGIYPNALGYQRIADVVKPKIGGVRADRIDAAACKKLEDEIALNTKAIIKRTTIAASKAESIKGFAENIKKTNAPELTTNPNEVLYQNRVVRKNVDWYTHGYATSERGTAGMGMYGGDKIGSNNKNGFFRVPMSPQKPGWTAVGDVSYYGKADARGKLEAGTTEHTATGEEIRKLTLSGGMVAANWHLPLNTIVAVRAANGQTYHFRTVDRGPLVVFDENGKRPVRGPENPWPYSTKFFDLTPSAMEKLCFMTGDRTTFTVVAYNASPGYNPPQPNQNPDGTITIDKAQCQKARKLIGQNMQRTFGPTNSADNNTYYQPGDMDSANLEGSRYEYVVVDDSPLRGLKDFIQLVSFTNSNFGWMSAAMVPTSYEFFKYINMYFVNDATGQMNSLDSVFAETTKGKFDELSGQDSTAGLDAAGDYLVKDLIGANGVWFIVPGFEGIYRNTSRILNDFVFAADRQNIEDNSGDDVVEVENFVPKNMLRALVAGTLSISAGGVGGFASGGEASISSGKNLLAAMAVISALSDSYEAHMMMKAILAFLISVAVVVFMTSVFTLMLITSFIVIKIILYFVSVILFFTSAPIVGIVAAYDGRGWDYFVSFVGKLLVFMVTPILIIIPVYLFIPISELMKGLLIAMIKAVLVVMEIGAENIGSTGISGTISKITLIAGMEGIVGILSIFLSFIVTLILMVNFRGWVMEKIGLQGDLDIVASAFGALKQKAVGVISPI